MVPDDCSDARALANTVVTDNCSPECDTTEGERCINGTCYSADNCPDDADFETICTRCFHRDEIPELANCGLRSVRVAAGTSTPVMMGQARSETYLLAMLGGSRETICQSAGASDVGVVGAYLNTLAAGSWVTTSNEGKPIVLGKTNSRRSPSLLPVEGMGLRGGKFLVAYPNLDDGVTIHTVGPVPALDPTSIQFPAIRGAWSPDPDAARRRSRMLRRPVWPCDFGHD